MFDIGIIDILGNTHLAYDFDKTTGETLLVFYRGESMAVFKKVGKCIMNKGFSTEILHQFGDIVRLNRDKVESYINNGEDLI